MTCNDTPRKIIASHQHIVMFDGDCAFCSGWVAWLSRFDREHRLVYCAMQSETGQALLRWLGRDLQHYETMLLISGGEVFSKTTAILEIGKALSGAGRCLQILRLIPRPLRDKLYDAIATQRYRLGGVVLCTPRGDLDPQARLLR